MKNVVRSAIATFLACGLGHADGGVLTFTVNVDQDTISIGQSVDWQIFATVSDSSSDNFGIASIGADLQDSTSDALVPGTIGAPFSDYDFLSGGTVNGFGQLEAIGATLFGYDAGKVEAADGSLLGPLLLASGSYSPLTVGSHSLSAMPTSASNEYFDSITGIGSSTPFDFGVHVSDTFTVTAVPEPSTTLAIGVLAVAFALRRRISNAASASLD
ncbi:PEP-CTERM sorting domain-containing protein [Fuerstiella marisgermanici]|uniref:Ice-binding protein C-terminal domain-containing protein n=1 Tax=Fuerstiella marisgermanici TaxID=1891926 RepID=A0A1P8WPA5_9PLAN|nr:PEP-CTERM sorting domain-containing protein [Fuerstiella marisgermanici]APZ95887.1 hypothetical protein Fuma_05550 [Fuerstiella marisgermanici]